MVAAFDDVQKFDAFISARNACSRNPADKANRACLATNRIGVLRARKTSSRSSCRDRPSRRADIRGKQARPLFLRATRDSRCGHPCSCRSRWSRQPDVVLAHSAQQLFSMRGDPVVARGSGAFPALAHVVVIEKVSTSPTLGQPHVSSFGSRDGPTARLRRGANKINGVISL